MLFPKENEDIKKELQLLSIKKFFARICLSDHTLYLDEEKIPRQDMKNDEIYLNNHAKTHFEKDIRSLCECYGIDTISIPGAKDSKAKKIELGKNLLNEKNVYRQYKTPDIAKLIVFINKSRKLKYYDLLMEEKILLPIKITNPRLNPFYIEMKVKNKQNQERELKLIALFTENSFYEENLKEYKILEDFPPILVSLNEITKDRNYRKNYDGFIINPNIPNCSIVLTKEIIKLIEKRG